jgi:hypothetical protein
MYGYEPDPYRHRGYDSGFEALGPDPDERLRLVAYVDGRLVETWTEPVEASPWAGVAERFDREHERPAPPPPVPTYERVLAWLDDVCGGRDAVLALTPTPLEDQPDVPEVESPQARSRLSAVAELLDAVAARRFDPEAAIAFRVCLLRVWDREPDVVLDAVTAAHVAGGVAWLVAKANGVLGPQGRVTVTRLKEELALHATPSTYGKVIHRALVGYRELTSERTGRLYELPDLLPIGHPDLLLASTRRTLCRARDRALEAQQTTAA